MQFLIINLGISDASPCEDGEHRINIIVRQHLSTFDGHSITMVKLMTPF